MKSKFRIAVLGIGGVGGYFGGKLAAHFADLDEVEIIFIARGENAKAIQVNGLRVLAPNEDFVSKPNLVTNDSSEIGKVDLFLVCTKAYDLAESISRYQGCIGENTAILPLLNGVNHAETIKQIFPHAEVWNGCVFIVARLVEPGLVKVESDIRQLQFGSLDDNAKKLEHFEKILHESDINAEFTTDIDKTVWEKFIFISSLATLTSYLDTNIKGILSSTENENLLIALIGEISQLARAKKINVRENIEEWTLNRIKSAPPESTSSMHSDFMKKGKTELETLTGFVVREAKLLGVQTPVYERLYQELSNRI